MNEPVASKWYEARESAAPLDLTWFITRPTTLAPARDRADMASDTCFAPVSAALVKSNTPSATPANSCASEAARTGGASTRTKSKSWQSLAITADALVLMRSAAVRDIRPAGIRDNPGCANWMIASEQDALPLRTSVKPTRLATLNFLGVEHTSK